MTSSPLPIAPFLLGAAFLGATGAAWAWFHVAPKQFELSYEFQPCLVIPGWTFVPEPISEGARETLATTNLFNGIFTNATGERVTIFMGTWDAGNPSQMSVVAHTPDVCWVGAGWTPAQGDYPEKLNLSFGTNSLRFELRAFATPDRRSLEMTAWCTLVNGQVFEEPSRFRVDDDAAHTARRARGAPGGRHNALANLKNAIGKRIPGSGSKQFVRFSTASDRHMQASIERLQSFSSKWLELRSVSPPR